MSTQAGQLPHAHLYARLRCSPGKGVGVFAIRRIPRGFNPFVGDSGGSTRVPSAAVDAIADPELRRMYLDFCPLIDGHYLAPLDFNALSISWYMNHSDQPNVVCDETVNFAAGRTIEIGEELLVDYRTFSDHADRYVAAWRAGVE